MVLTEKSQKLIVLLNHSMSSWSLSSTKYLMDLSQIPELGFAPEVLVWAEKWQTGPGKILYISFQKILIQECQQLCPQFMVTGSSSNPARWGSWTPIGGVPALSQMPLSHEQKGSVWCDAVFIKPWVSGAPDPLSSAHPSNPREWLTSGFTGLACWWQALQVL